MGQTSDPETLVIHQKMTPGNNPEHYDHGGSLQLHTIKHVLMNTYLHQGDVYRLGGQCLGKFCTFSFLHACL